MNLRRRTRQWTWAVMAWMGMSLLVANVAPLMRSGVPMEVCSTTGGGTRLVDDPANSSRLGHTWQCAQCLPFVAPASDATPWQVPRLPVAMPLALAFRSWLQTLALPYGARAPPTSG